MIEKSRVGISRYKYLHVGRGTYEAPDLGRFPLCMQQV